MDTANETLMLVGGVNGRRSRKSQLILDQRISLIASTFDHLPRESAFRVKVEAPEAGIFFFEEARRMVFRDELQIMHLSGFVSEDGRLEFAEGEPGEGLDAHELARWLTRFPKLKLVFLDGCATPELVEAILRSDVPAVIALEGNKASGLPGKEASVFYSSLAEGLTLAQAYARTFTQFPKSFPLRHAAYDLDSDTLSWEGKSDHSALLQGMYLLSDRAVVMDWKPIAQGAPVKVRQAGAGFQWALAGFGKRPRLFASGFIVIALAALLFSLLKGPQRLQHLASQAVAWQKGCLFEGYSEVPALWLGVFDREKGFSSPENALAWQRLFGLSSSGKFTEMVALPQESLPDLGSATAVIQSCEATSALAIQRSVYRNDSMEWVLLAWQSKGDGAEQFPPLIWHSNELPAQVFFHWWAAEMHSSMGNPSRAMEALIQIPLENHPDYIPVARKLAVLYSQSQTHAYALAYADQAVNLGDTDKDLRLLRAKLNTLNGKYAEALNDYQVVLAQDSAHADALFEQGVLQFSLKETQAAKATALTLLRNHQQLGKSHGLRAAVAAAEGDLPRAVFELKESRRLGFDPADMEVLWVVLGPVVNRAPATK